MERSTRLRDCDPREVFRSISQYESVNEERRSWNGKAYTRAANNLIESPMRTEWKEQGKGSKVDKTEPMKIREKINFLGNRRDKAQITRGPVYRVALIVDRFHFGCLRHVLVPPCFYEYSSRKEATQFPFYRILTLFRPRTIED